MAASQHDDPSPTWNIWFTLMVISGAITILAGILEAIGVWHDLGVGVGVIGLAATVMFGQAGATRALVHGLDRRLDRMHDTLQHILLVLDRRLPK